jgi:hypothetical protein
MEAEPGHRAMILVGTGQRGISDFCPICPVIWLSPGYSPELSIMKLDKTS